MREQIYLFGCFAIGSGYCPPGRARLFNYARTEGP